MSTLTLHAPALVSDISPVPAVVIRPARVADAERIAALVNGYAAEGIMLPRTAQMVELAAADYVVATDERGRLLACGALREYSPSIAEVSSIAVARDAHGLGLGTRIVTAVEALARKRDVGEVFALTMSPRFFETLGYAIVDVGLYPEKQRGCADICMRKALGAGSRELSAAA